MGCRPPGAVLVRSAAEQRLDGQIAFPGFPVPHCPAALTYQERTGWPAGFAPVGKMTCMKNGDWLRLSRHASAGWPTATSVRAPRGSGLVLDSGSFPLRPWQHKKFGYLALLRGL